MAGQEVLSLLSSRTKLRSPQFKLISYSGILRHRLMRTASARGCLAPGIGCQPFAFLRQINFMNSSTLRIENNLQTCLDSCLQCLVACELCATACLEEENSQAMIRCIQLDRICADLCALAARAIARRSDLVSQVCALCVLACRSCSKECARHSHSDHCKRCAAACRRCEKECQKIAAGTSQTTLDLQNSLRTDKPLPVKLS